MHRPRSKHWVDVSSSVNGEREIHINTHEHTFIQADYRRQLQNLGNITCMMIKVQSGSNVGEDDIVRFEDNYPRDCISDRKK